MALDLRDRFLRKALPTSASTFEPSFSLERKQSRHKTKNSVQCHRPFFYLAATTVVFVGRRVFVGSFEACMTLSMQHGRLNSAILFLAIARRSAFFFLRQRLCQFFSSLPMNWPTEAKSHCCALMIITICLLLQALTAWPSKESSLSGFPFGSSVAMTL